MTQTFRQGPNSSTISFWPSIKPMQVLEWNSKLNYDFKSILIWNWKLESSLNWNSFFRVLVEIVMFIHQFLSLNQNAHIYSPIFEFFEFNWNVLFYSPIFKLFWVWIEHLYNKLDLKIQFLQTFRLIKLAFWYPSFETSWVWVLAPNSKKSTKNQVFWVFSSLIISSRAYPRYT